MLQQLTWGDIALPSHTEKIGAILPYYISDGMINIGESEWLLLNSFYSQEEIVDGLADEILCGHVKLPTKVLTIDDAKASFRDLMSYESNGLRVGRLATRYPYEFTDMGAGLYISESNIGNAASNYFQQENRFACGSINSPSPVRTWGNRKFLKGALNALWSLNLKCVNENTLRTCLSLRKYVASQFKPTIAKTIYEAFGSVDVLDFSAGWGDRLCGFYACEDTRSYIGIDPNKNVLNKYSEQVDLYKTVAGEKETTFICSPAEDVHLGKGIVDTVFTSPPYFNVERYTEDENQSFKRYRKLDAWLECFLFKAIDLSVDALKPNGRLAINISDCYSSHQVNHICDPMNRYIASKGMQYQGVIGMQMTKRPNSKAFKDGVFVEPIWVWKKGE